MGIIILCVIIGICFLIRERCFSDGINDLLPAILIIAISVLIGFVISGLSTCIFLPSDEVHYELQSETPIVAMKDNGAITGHRFLFGGGTKGNLKYYYAVDTEAGIIVKDTDASNSYIRYDNESPRHLHYVQTGFNHWATNLYAIKTGKSFDAFYVPEDSVDLSFYIDLE